ncbi:hypothetical protein EYC84_005467 [Monilinia fructicola]|uniref:Uncharacterized protein n=1 Tax=Monilinia fructicola TaxID=38448 RepID=A0A5M9K1R0_MONFR|nr:hypothetical protein EYC84_005467 [Monilinia fructicola]
MDIQTYIHTYIQTNIPDTASPSRRHPLIHIRAPLPPPLAPAPPIRPAPPGKLPQQDEARQDQDDEGRDGRHQDLLLRDVVHGGLAARVRTRGVGAAGGPAILRLERVEVEPDSCVAGVGVGVEVEGGREAPRGVRELCVFEGGARGGEGVGWWAGLGGVGVGDGVGGEGPVGGLGGGAAGGVQLGGAVGCVPMGGGGVEGGAAEEGVAGVGGGEKLRGSLGAQDQMEEWV